MRLSLIANAWSLGCALALGVCAAGTSGAAPLSADIQREVTALVDKEMAERKLPGVVVGVWMPGAAPWTLARGKADLATGRERAVGDPFRIASITKTFIGTAILTLVDAGKLKTTDKLARWYPDFPNAQQITVGDLLRMRSGIPDSADKAFLEEYYDKPFITLTPDDMIARSAARKAEFEPPNTVARYVNTNFMILERIVEKVSGTDIQSYLARHVFGPLKLKGTLYPRGVDLDSPLRGYSYEAARGSLVDRTRVNPIPAGGAGAIVSTLDDLHVYARALCRGKLLRPATQAARLVTTQLEGAPAIVRYGEAVGTLGRFCGHNGTIFGFSSEMWYLPERDAVVVVSVNRLDKDDASQSSEIFLKISRVLFPGLTDW